MAKYKIVHYINQFFANVGGEDMADYKPELREGAMGPGLKLAELLGEDYEIVGTIICETTTLVKILMQLLKLF